MVGGQIEKVLAKTPAPAPQEAKAPVLPQVKQALAQNEQVTKVTKSDGAVTRKTEQAPATNEDLSIPDFLRRSATPEALQPVQALQAAAKLNAKSPPPYVPVLAHEMLPANELTMTPRQHGEYTLANAQSKGMVVRDPKAWVDSVEKRNVWKDDAATKLAQLFPQENAKLANGFRGELYSTDARKPIEQLREHLKKLDPSKAAQVDSILSDTHLGRVWTKRAGAYRSGP